MNTDDEWLDRQLRDVLNDLHDRHAEECQRELAVTLDSVIMMNEVMVNGRYDQSIAHLIMAVGFALHKGLSQNPNLMAERNMSDEELRQLVCALTWGDLERLFSQLGKTLWMALWRPK